MKEERCLTLGMLEKAFDLTAKKSETAPTYTLPVSRGQKRFLECTWNEAIERRANELVGRSEGM
jgi:hypothetical protein